MQMNQVTQLWGETSAAQPFKQPRIQNRNSMSIYAQENNLFAEWRRSRSDIVLDGVVDEDLYLQSDPKLLFIMKEVNDPDGGGWDLREFLRNGGRAQSWNNITRWVEGIRNLPDDIDWHDLETIDNHRRMLALNTIAAMNLRKLPGGHTSNYDQIRADAIQDREMINRQFQLYPADFVICCGNNTCDLLHEIIRFPSEPDWRLTRRGTWHHKAEPGKFVIQYSHPAARCAYSLLHYGIVDAIREIRGY